MPGKADPWTPPVKDLRGAFALSHPSALCVPTFVGVTPKVNISIFLKY